MAGVIKSLSVLLACGVAANVYLAWELNNRLPPSTAEIDRDLAALAETPTSVTTDDSQVRAEVALYDAIREQTLAMLKQRRASTLHFVDVQYTVNGTAIRPADSNRLTALEADIAKQKDNVKAAAALAGEVEGGAIRSLRLANLGLVQTTLALLERSYFSEKYGIAPPNIITPTTSSAPAAASSWADKDGVSAIEADIAERRGKVEETRKEADQYAGGLIKVTLLLRLAIEGTTLSMLEQRELALKHNLPSIPGLRPVISTIAPPESLSAIDTDINSTRDAISAGEQEASRYSGGLIYVTILSRIATQKVTLAMLNQRRLAIKYGLMGVPAGADGDAAVPKKGPPGTIVNDKDAL